MSLLSIQKNTKDNDSFFAKLISLYRNNPLNLPWATFKSLTGSLPKTCGLLIVVHENLNLEGIEPKSGHLVDNNIVKYYNGLKIYLVLLILIFHGLLRVAH